MFRSVWGQFHEWKKAKKEPTFWKVKKYKRKRVKSCVLISKELKMSCNFGMCRPRCFSSHNAWVCLNKGIVTRFGYRQDKIFQTREIPKQTVQHKVQPESLEVGTNVKRKQEKDKKQTSYLEPEGKFKKDRFVKIITKKPTLATLLLVRLLYLVTCIKIQDR